MKMTKAWVASAALLTGMAFATTNAHAEEVTTQQVIINGKVQTIDVKTGKKIENANAETTKDIKKEPRTADVKPKTDKKTHVIHEKQTQKTKPHRESPDKITIKRVVGTNGHWKANSADDIRANMKAQGITTDSLLTGIMYQIKYGDTLSRISAVSDIDMHKIAKDNNIKDVNKIYAGDNLFLQK